MPEISVTPNLPNLPAPAAAAPAQGAAPANDPAAADAAAPRGFAAVLQNQLARGAAPADAVKLAAELPQDAGDDANGLPSAAADPGQPAGDTGLAALLPALQALLVNAKSDAAPADPAGAAPTAAAGTSPLPGKDAGLFAADAKPTAASAKDTGAGLAAAADKPGPHTADFAAQLAAAAETAGRAAAGPTHAQAGADLAATAAAAPQAHQPLGHVGAQNEGNAATPLRVDTPVAARGWDQDVGQKLVLLMNRNEHRAELTLTPPQLGKLEVTLTVSGDQTSALFVSANPTVREALEQALPRLRETLADAGVQLGQANVSAESSRGGHDDGGSRRGGRGAAGAPSAGSAPVSQWVSRGNGLIDTFA